MKVKSLSFQLFGAALLRGILFFWGFYDVFGFRKEIVTPITDFKRLVEGLFFLLKLEQNPYAGDAYHQPPLLLALFYPIQDSELLIRIVFVVLDLLIAVLLALSAELWQKRNFNRIAQDKAKLDDQKKIPILSRDDLPSIVSFIYLFNPLTVMSCVGMSTIGFSSFGVAASVYWALRGNQTLSAFFIAFAGYLTLYPIQLFLALSTLLEKRGVLSTLIQTIFWTGVLWGLSALLVPSWALMEETYGFLLSVQDLSPNIGVFWYFFTEVFKHFRLFYLFAYQYHAFIYFIPLYIRMRHHPMFLVWVNLAIIATFKSYPAVGDIALQIAFLPLIFDLIRGNRYVYIVAIVGVFSMVLAPIFWLMWIYQGTGNANFYYAINLVTTMAQVFFIIDSVSVVLKEDYLEKKGLKDEPKKTAKVE